MKGSSYHNFDEENWNREKKAVEESLELEEGVYINNKVIILKKKNQKKKRKVYPLSIKD